MPKASWDVVKAKQLYDENKSHTEIAKACGVSPSAVSGYGDRHWQTREIDAIRHAKKFHAKKEAVTLAQQIGKSAIAAAGKTTLPPLGSLTFDGIGVYTKAD